MSIKVDNYTRIMLSVIAVLLAFVAIGMWYEAPSTVTPAYGKIPDQAEQLNTIIQKLDKIEAANQQLTKLLTSGKIKVQIVDEPVAEKTTRSTTRSVPKVR